MAAQKVFAIPELLDAILTDLDIRELFIDQRVCKTWRDWIQASKLLANRFLSYLAR